MDDDALQPSRIMVENRAIKGYSIVPSRKRTVKARRYDSVRMCAREDCNTQLSTYNKGPYCYAHAPVKSPRIRGRQYVR